VVKYFFVSLVFASILFSSNALCEPNWIGYSGAPGSNGSCAISCHGNSSGTIEISGFPVEYTPGQIYTVSITHSAGSSIRQFNGSCRIGIGAQNGGVISSGANTSTYSTGNETNGIRFSSYYQNNGTFDWTAPSSGAGQMKLYIAGLQGGYSCQNSTLVFISAEASSGPVCDYVVGDVNDNSNFNGLDVTYGVAYFKGGAPPPYECECTSGNTWFVGGDTNQSCSYNGLDVTYNVSYFKTGTNPPQPCSDCPPIG